MANNNVAYAMSVISMQQDDQGLVVFATFELTGTCGQAVGRFTGAVQLLAPAPGAPVVPLADVTQEDAVAWVVASLNAPGKIGIEGAKAEVLIDLARQQAPPARAVELPWLSGV